MKLIHFNGVLAEVDDEYGAELLETGGWKKARARRAPAPKTETGTPPADQPEPPQE